MRVIYNGEKINVENQIENISEKRKHFYADWNYHSINIQWDGEENTVRLIKSIKNKC